VYPLFLYRKKIKEASISVENNKAITRQLTELLDQGNVEKLNELLSSDIVYHFAGLPHPLNREQYIQVNCAAKNVFSDLKRTVEDLVAEADKVTVCITARGMHTGEFQVIPATGRHTEITGIAGRRIADGKIAEEWVINDQLRLMQQLGIFHLPAQASR
jgi:steroid delta-isomerase-like uncharacterized protein